MEHQGRRDFALCWQCICEKVNCNPWMSMHSHRNRQSYALTSRWMWIGTRRNTRSAISKLWTFFGLIKNSTINKNLSHVCSKRNSKVKYFPSRTPKTRVRSFFFVFCVCLPFLLIAGADILLSIDMPLNINVGLLGHVDSGYIDFSRDWSKKTYQQISFQARQRCLKLSRKYPAQQRLIRVDRVKKEESRLT